MGLEMESFSFVWMPLSKRGGFQTIRFQTKRGEKEILYPPSAKRQRANKWAPFIFLRFNSICQELPFRARGDSTRDRRVQSRADRVERDAADERPMG